MTLLPVAEAQARLLALAPPLSIERVALIEATGRWSAVDVLAGRDQPAADLSAMDGYAIRFAELPGPWRVIGESKAGTALDRTLAPGEAARIFTGAPVPQGADTILVQEEATRDGAMLRLAGAGPPRRGAHVRQRASDFAGGQTLIGAGDHLGPIRIALAAMGGHGALAVHRRPHIVLLSTGDELVPPGAPVTDVTLPASNGPMLHALLQGTSAIVQDRGILPDRMEALTQGFLTAAADADIIVTTGGASVGDHDLVRPALAAVGASLDFWRVAMRPGKPLMAGRLGDATVLGLPGNPVSAFVTAQLFLLPLVAHLSGDPAPLPRPDRATVGAPLAATGERADYIRARLDGGIAYPLIGQDSAALGKMAEADVLIVRSACAPALMTGESIDILRIA